MYVLYHIVKICCEDGDLANVFHCSIFLIQSPNIMPLGREQGCCTSQTANNLHENQCIRVSLTLNLCPFFDVLFSFREPWGYDSYIQSTLYRMLRCSTMRRRQMRLKKRVCSGLTFAFCIRVYQILLNLGREKGCTSSFVVI